MSKDELLDKLWPEQQVVSETALTRCIAEALADLAEWQVNRIAHPPLIQEAWRHRHNVSRYDAF